MQKYKLGILGGMSWQSTQLYYHYLNEGMAVRQGGLHSLELLLYSFDFERIASLQAQGDWQTAAETLVTAAQSLKQAGAERLLIATNTMHKMADEIEQETGLEIFHIADATAQAIQLSSSENPLLLATNFTMTQSFYKGRLADKHDIHVTVPNDGDRQFVHDVIYHELCQGHILPHSKTAYRDLIKKYQDEEGIDGVILGCTEIGLLLSQSDLDMPCFDTTKIHCDYVLDKLLS